MDDLVRWIGEQLDEETARAIAAIDELDGPSLGADWRYDGRSVETVRERTMVAVGSQDHMGPEVGEHIAAHDPARALREVDAKRQALEEHQDVNDGSCGTCVDGRWGYPSHGGSSPQRFPCRTLRLLALPFADRPGYLEGWAP
ncbi:DUF6221 family protein [Streptomyces sp. NPDC000888]